MSEDVFLKFTYDERDIVNGMRLRAAGRLRGVHFLGVLAFGLALVLGCVYVPVVTSLAGQLTFAGLGVLVLAGLALGVRAARPTMFRGTFEPTRDAPVTADGLRDATMSIDASDDGVVVTVASQMARISWDACGRFQKDARSYVLHHGKDGFLVVPRRAFRNEKRDAAFRDLVAEWVEGAPAVAEPPAPEEASGAPDVVATSTVEEVKAEASEPAAALLPAPEAAGQAKAPQVGRNDPCPCGSGKKYKKCCLDQADAAD